MQRRTVSSHAHTCTYTHSWIDWFVCISSIAHCKTTAYPFYFSLPHKHIIHSLYRHREKMNTYNTYNDEDYDDDWNGVSYTAHTTRAESSMKQRKVKCMVVSNWVSEWVYKGKKYIQCEPNEVKKKKILYYFIFVRFNVGQTEFLVDFNEFFGQFLLKFFEIYQPSKSVKCF